MKTSTRLLASSRLWERIKYDWRLDVAGQRDETPAEHSVYVAIDDLLATRPTVAQLDAVASLIEALSTIPSPYKPD